MATVDSWTDETVERALHLLRVGECIVRFYRRPPKGDGIRPVTIDRWLIDAAEFMAHNPMSEEETHEAAAY